LAQPELQARTRRPAGLGLGGMHDWLGAAFCISGRTDAGNVQPGSGSGLTMPRAAGTPPGQTPRRPPRGSDMNYPDDEWQRKGATLSDKTARQEFGLTQDEIYDAIDAGTLHYRRAAM